MKTQKEMWKDINKPKVKETIPIFDENGKLASIAQVLDRPPIWWIEKQRRKQK